MKPTVRPLTKDDYFDLPETGPRYQLIDGELFMAPSPDRFHQDISRSIFLEICNLLEKHAWDYLQRAFRCRASRRGHFPTRHRLVFGIAKGRAHRAWCRRRS
jgi:hypothetical protein